MYSHSSSDETSGYVHFFVPEKIKSLFPATYGTARVELVPGTDADLFHTPINIGVVLSGGQAPGGHNVIAGVFDFAKKCSPDSKVFGCVLQRMAPFVVIMT